MAGDRRAFPLLCLVFWISSLLSISLAYRPGDIVPMSKSRTVWQDVIGRHCPIFAVNREALIPIPKPTGFTGADPYKISFQVGHEKFHVPWLFVINRKSSEVPMINFHLKYSGNDLHGVTAKVVDMPHHYVEVHQDIGKNFWDPNHWPKHVLVRYTWEERSEIDVPGGFYVMFGSVPIIEREWENMAGLIMIHELFIGLALSFILAIYVLQSSQDKLARFVRETVAESSIHGGVAKVE
uniref:Uncharacterized protein LOC105044806 isoform X2 n=1 Tax=Elaeis guineensis var. tenera TaxID=51953 RepID=A0A6J0PJD1_ELAGV|nr:uncharacterized protein LOC105044806 isoform X2 [Elaeis guineensis]